MLKIRIAMLLAALVMVTGASAQDAQSARLRIMQLSYVLPSSLTVDIRLDDVLTFEAIRWPFATDYVELAAGEHTLTTTLVDQPEASASTAITLESGNSYSVVVDGDYSEQVSFIVVEETEALADAPGSTATIVNLTDQAISDITIDDAPILAEISSGGYGFVSLPPAEASIGGLIGELAYSETFTPFANTDFLIAVRQSDGDEPQVIYHRSSRLTIAEYLRAVHEGAEFERAAALLAQTDMLDSLADDGAYTVFLPINEIVDELAAANLIPDAAQLGSLFATHVTAQNLPPYLLPQHETVTTLAGNTATINFGATDSGYWEIEGAPILWDVRLANGVIYGIYGAINPAS